MGAVMTSTTDPVGPEPVGDPRLAADPDADLVPGAAVAGAATLAEVGPTADAGFAGDDEPRVDTTDRHLPRLPRPGRRFDLVVAAVVTVFVVWNLRPWTWFLDSTPTGGDLGAHVWSPAYLRDVLLPSWRLTGWTGDWYAGFPAFTFYMVLPSLAVVAVNVGLAGPLPALAAGAIGAVAVRLRRRLDDPWSRRLLVVAAAV
ncbi:MAG: hypothetical protein D6683_08140, partial [Actinomyces sp.]